MAQLPNAFNTPENSQSMEDRTALEKGDYIMVIKASEMKPTSTGGQMLVLTFVVVEGPRKGGHVWIRLNLVNKSNQAMEIAYKSLNSICQAVGKQNLTDSNDLHNLPMRCTVVVIPEKDGYPESNDISAYEKSGGAMPTPAVSSKPEESLVSATHSVVEPPQKKAPAPAETSANVNKLPWE